MEWQDVGNVVAFTHACKGNYGSNRNCSANLVVAPGLKSMFGNHGSGGAPCAEETNNGHGSTFANKFFQHNICVQPVEGSVPAYLFQSCDASSKHIELNSSVWGTEGNRFWVPNSTHVYVPCHGKGASKIPLGEWMTKYGQDIGATIEPIPPIDNLIDQAAAILGIR